MGKDWNALEVLKHSRHDWLNKLQLIKGNIALDRMERVEEIVNDIVMEAKQDTHLTNLRIDTLALLLMTYNWDDHNFIVEYEVLGEVRDLSAYDQAMYKWCDHFFQMLDQAVHHSGDNHLSLSVDLTEKQPRFFLDFSGIIKDKDVIKKWAEDNQANPIIKLKDWTIGSAELSIIASIG